MIFFLLQIKELKKKLQQAIKEEIKIFNDHNHDWGHFDGDRKEPVFRHRPFGKPHRLINLSYEVGIIAHLS